MSSGWLFFRDNKTGVKCAVSLSAVNRILKEGDEDFGAALEDAHSLLPVSEVDDSTITPLVVVLNNGRLWAASEVESDISQGKLRYVAIPPHLLKSHPPWCRGVLCATSDDRFFVVNTDIAGSDNE